MSLGSTVGNVIVSVLLSAPVSTLVYIGLAYFFSDGPIDDAINMSMIVLLCSLIVGIPFALVFATPILMLFNPGSKVLQLCGIVFGAIAGVTVFKYMFCVGPGMTSVSAMTGVLYGDLFALAYIFRIRRKGKAGEAAE